MTIYNTKNTLISWRGITLEGFGSEKINISQNSESIKTVIGIFGEYFNYPNVKRQWIISSEFLINSPSYKILCQDNLNHREGTLVIRDLNNGTEFTDIFTNCVISSIGQNKDGNPVKITWTAVKRNLK